MSFSRHWPAPYGFVDREQGSRVAEVAGHHFGRRLHGLRCWQARWRHSFEGFKDQDCMKDCRSFLRMFEDHNDCTPQLCSERPLLGQEHAKPVNHVESVKVHTMSCLKERANCECYGYSHDRPGSQQDGAMEKVRRGSFGKTTQRVLQKKKDSSKKPQTHLIIKQPRQNKTNSRTARTPNKAQHELQIVHGPRDGKAGSHDPRGEQRVFQGRHRVGCELVFHFDFWGGGGRRGCVVEDL